MYRIVPYSFSISVKDWQIGGHKVDSAGQGFETSKLKYVVCVACSILLCFQKTVTALLQCYSVTAVCSVIMGDPCDLNLEESREDRKAALSEAAFLRSLDHDQINRALSQPRREPMQRQVL